jgi:GntR family transcriptional regulator, transcriptional repressor for pyruvate dehydrogenase complex
MSSDVLFQAMATEPTIQRPRRPPKVSETVARDIVATIVDGGFEPGQMLPAEAVMLERYGVGRASLREALRLLEVSELIRIKPGAGGGPVVGNVDPSALGRNMSLFFQMSGATLRDLLEARVEVELAIIGLLVRQPDEVLERVERLVTETHATDITDDANFVASSFDFHVELCRLCGNPILGLVAISLMQIFMSRVDKELYPLERRSTVLAEHVQLAEAIRSRDRERAESLTRAHLESYKESVMARHPALIDRVIQWE